MIIKFFYTNIECKKMRILKYILYEKLYNVNYIYEYVLLSFFLMNLVC